MELKKPYCSTFNLLRTTMICYIINNNNLLKVLLSQEQIPVQKTCIYYICIYCITNNLDIHRIVLAPN